MSDNNSKNKPNRLIEEQSPYLLQHAYNPVDWYPWGEEAFEKARKEDKPIFLSIGYSTCHWCHVMERESFEDNEVAKLMNDVFVSIKVDREERPDIDNIYMSVCQMMTGGGGWPLNVIMTPDKKPFFSGTYFPKDDRGGRIGMINLIGQIKDVWRNRREDVDKATADILQHLNSYSNETPGDKPDKKSFDIAFNAFTVRYDQEHGGFGNAPKFPSPQNFLYLLRYFNRTGDMQALTMVTKTLREMRLGGMYDHIGFGFHRYSTDKEWLLPHFEKMLYDQAMLMMAYTEAYQVTGDAFFKQTAYEIMEYVLRDMTNEHGGFFSAEDADSDGEEGKFYIWGTAEIDSILGTEDAELVTDLFNLKEEGNFMDEATRALVGQNIFHLKSTLNEYAEEKGLNKNELRARVENIIQVLYDKREKRIKPLKDDKILTDWNGLMIAALAKAGRVFGSEQALNAAIDAASFIDRRMKVGEKLLHRYRQGEAAIDAHLDDYAFYTWGLIELYEATADYEFLNEANTLTKIMINDFWDEKDGAFFFTADSAETHIIRKKEIFDAAIPSGNSVACYNMLRLGRITGNTDLEVKADSLFRYAAGPLDKASTAFTMLLNGLDFSFGPAKEIIIAGNQKSAGFKEIQEALFSQYLPNSVVVYVPSADDKITKLAEYTKNYTSEDGKVMVYVCSNYACNLPVDSADEMLAQLK